MNACVLESVGSLVYKQVDKPIPKDDEVLVKIKACGICSSDNDRVFKTGTYHFPTIPGHEFAGEIVEVGKNISGDYIGKHTIVFPLIPCLECESCQSQVYERCDNYNYFGSRCDGGFAEYIAIPLWNAVLVEDTLDYRVAALCENTAVALHAVKKVDIQKDILVIGTGTIGILTAMWALERGAATVTIAGRNKEKLEFIRRLDKVEILNLNENLDNENKYDVVFECVGKNESISNSICMVKKGGTVVFVGNPDGNIDLDRNVYWKILRNELKIQGTWNSSKSIGQNDWNDSVQFLEKNSEKLMNLITHQYSLSEFDKAFQVLKNPKEFKIKVMFNI